MKPLAIAPQIPPTAAYYNGNQNRNRIMAAAEQFWLQYASAAQLIGDIDKAQNALELILRRNPYHAGAFFRLGHLLHNQQHYVQAIEAYQKAIQILEGNPSNLASSLVSGGVASVWASSAHCFLLLDELPKAFNAYQQALSCAGGIKDSTLWFGIGLLYDRYGSDDFALEAFSTVLRLEGVLSGGSLGMVKIMPSPMLKEVYYRIGYLLRFKKLWEGSLKCLEYSLHFPPNPLKRGDLKLQIALTLKAKGEWSKARTILEEIIEEEKGPSSLLNKSRCHLGFIMVKYLGQSNEGTSLIQRTTQEDPSDALNWYFLGLVYQIRKMPSQSYEAYQEAVYRDGQNAAFWNSIGILYLEIKQYRDALDAFSRAIHQSPNISEVWWNLGILYESCNNQLNDALDAYQKAVEYSPKNSTIMAKIASIQDEMAGNLKVTKAPSEPWEIDPYQFITRPILLGSAAIPPQKANPLALLSSINNAAANRNTIPMYPVRPKIPPTMTMRPSVGIPISASSMPPASTLGRPTTYNLPRPI